MNEQLRAILHMDHHVSAVRRQMPNIERAAQFAPFAALTGFSDCIDLAAYIPQAERVLDEEGSAKLNEVLAKLQELPAGERAADLTYVTRSEKYGPTYITERVMIRSVDPVARTLVLQYGRVIAMNDVSAIRLAGDGEDD